MTNATLNVPNDVIDPIIRAEVTKAIIAAMGNQGQILTQAITSILAMQVDSEGKPSSYSSDRSKSWLDWAVGTAVRSAAKEAIQEAMAQQKDAIKKEMVRQMQMKNSPLVRQFVEGMVNAATAPDVLKYRISIAYDGK